MSKNTRNRQLAKQHSRRQAERRQHQRRRQTTTIAVALVIALVGSLAAFLVFTGGDEPPPAATGATTPTGSTGATAATGSTGSQTGTVKPEPGPDAVACGADQPRNALRPKPQFSAPGDVVKRGQTYTAEIETSCGTIVVDLFAEGAPETVNSFVFLAEQGYFDGQRFHRLDTSLSVVQGGDPTGTGTGGPGYSIPDELTGDEIYEPGILAMANAGPNTGGSQFFFVTGRGASGLPPNFTIFGRVTEGLVVLELIQQLPIQDPAGGIPGQQPAEAVYIEKVTIQQDR